MSTIHLKQTTTATPEQLVAGLTDSGPERLHVRTPRQPPAATQDSQGRTQGRVAVVDVSSWMSADEGLLDRVIV
jgi:hypothetical protein